jgi:hypothetical protein
MTKYLVSFPAAAMDVPAEEMAAVSEAAHGVIREAKKAGVYVFGGGINEEVAPLMVAANGTVTNERTRRRGSWTADFASWSCRLARRPSNGLRKSLTPVVARRNCASSSMTRRADHGPCMVLERG